MNQEKHGTEVFEDALLINILKDRAAISTLLDESTMPIQRKTFVTLANLHGIVPQLYRSVKNNTLKEKEKITLLYKQILHANLLLTANLMTVTKALEEKKYRYLSIKGPTLAQELYHDISMRQFSDIDLFVAEEDIYKISELLIELGYTPVLPLSLLKRKKFLELDNDFSFRHNKNNALLELHWKLFPKRHKMSLPFSELHARATKLSVQNREISTLSPEDNLLYLALHGAKHIFERYEWVYDLDQLIRTYPALNLTELHQRAKEIHVETAFLLGIFLSNHLFDTPIPKSLESDRTEHIQNLLESTLEYYKKRFVYWDESDKKRARFLFLAKLFQTEESKSLWLFKSLFKTTPVDVITFNLPDALAFLYPLLRPFRLLYKHLFRKKAAYA